MGSISLWQAETEQRLPFAPGVLRGPTQADVVVVGGGLTGAALALWLARAGVSVVVLEERYLAAGASGRNAGFLLAGTAEPYSHAIARYGHERARRLWAFSVANHEMAAALIDEMRAAGWECGYRQAGSMRIATTDEELHAIYESAERLSADDWHADRIARDDLPESLRRGYCGGSYHPRDGEVDPVRLARGVALLANRAGARFYQGSAARAVRDGSDGVQVETPRGTVSAGQVAMAANAWLPGLGIQLDATWLAAVIAPTRGQVMSTRPIHQKLFPCPCYADDGYQYWRQLDDGRLIVGGWRNHSLVTEATVDESPTEPLQQLLDDFVHVSLRLPRAAVEHRWAGVMAFTADGLPLVGRLPGTARGYVCGGYTGHGNAYALRSAYLLSEIMQGRHPDDADLFSSDRLLPLTARALRADDDQHAPEHERDAIFGAEAETRGLP